MLTIRLSRVGKKKQPEYRLVISEKNKDPWGDILEYLGHYNPLSNPITINLKVERIKYWLSKGAQMSDTVKNILIDQNILADEKKLKPRGIKNKKVEAVKPEEKSLEKKDVPADEKSSTPETPKAETKSEPAETEKK